MVGTSGGKDSLSLCVALTLRKKWVPIDYELHAVLIEWREYPMSTDNREKLELFFCALEMPFQVVTASLHPAGPDKPFNCFLCARNRKRILFGEARDRGCTKVALGHHMDDVVETTLMNLFFQGEFSTMMPVQEFFNGRMTVIRPLFEVKEADTARFARRQNLPVIASCCPQRETNRRVVMKDILRQVYRINRKVRENIYRSPWRINWEYLPVKLETEQADRGAKAKSDSVLTGRAGNGAWASQTARDIPR